MESNERPKIENDPSLGLATSIAQNIDVLVGADEWSGEHPYEIQMLDSRENKDYIYQLRRGDDWMTIQERVSDNPSLVRTFYLKKKGAAWTYEDPYQIKYGESSLPMLQTAYDRLRIAIEASAPRKLDDSPKELPKDTTEGSKE